MIHTDEDDEFARVKRENAMRKVQRLGQEIEGQPYHWDVYVSPSQRNQILEEAAKLCENSVEYAGDELARQIRGLKT